MRPTSKSFVPPAWPRIDVLDEEMLRLRRRRWRDAPHRGADTTAERRASDAALPMAEPLSEPKRADNSVRIAFCTTTDQVLSSLGNALLLFTVAQTASVSEFGVIAFLVAVASTGMCFNRGALGAPLLIASNLRADQVRTEAGYAMSFAALAGVGVAIALCLLGMASGQANVAFAFAAAVPAVLVQDVLRYAAISSTRPFVAIVSDGLWTVITFSLFIANAFGANITAEYAVIAWGSSGFVAAAILVLTLNVRLKLIGLLGWWRTYAVARMNFGIVEALSPAYIAAALLIVTTVADSEVAGSLRGASTLLGPIALLLSALPLIFVPHARRTVTSARDQWTLLVKTSMSTAALTLVAAAALCLVPPWLGSAAMGSTWGSAVAVIPYEGLAVAGNCCIASLLALFQAQGRSRIAFWVRLLQTSLQLLVCATVAFVAGTAVAIAASIAAAIWAIAIVGAVVARRLVRGADI